ncbi:hypothetical protein Tco_0403803 [Tanacetum coccineum]
MVAFLEKSTGSEGFHQVIDFLNRSHICYALTKKPDVYVSFIKQFWRSAEATTDDNGEVQITATIDGHSMTITEASLRRHLKLDDHDGITSIPNSEIFEQLALMGYHTDSDKLTFQKGAFSPQWRFLIHTILHCLSPKKTAWEQFSSNIATAVICLATNRTFNFSRLIFEHMVSNISSPHKFLMYPRFIQICLDMQRKQLQQHSRTYPVPSLSIKVFNNMKRPTKGYSGQEVALFPTMLNVSEPSTSPSRITSSPLPSPEPSPSHSPEPPTEYSPDHTTAVVSFPSPIQPTQPSPETEQHIPTPHNSPLHDVHSYGIKTGKARKRARVVLSEDDKDVEDDSFKQGRKSDAEVQGKASTETEPIIHFNSCRSISENWHLICHPRSSLIPNTSVLIMNYALNFFTPIPELDIPLELIKLVQRDPDQAKLTVLAVTLKLILRRGEENLKLEVQGKQALKLNLLSRSNSYKVIQDQGSSGERKILKTVTYRRRSEEERKRKDKGKAIMMESEPKKKSKKEIEQERLSIAEAIRLEEQMNEE